MKTNPYIDRHKDKFDKAIEHLKEELKQIRTGRASSSLIEHILVNAYGVKTPIVQLATITTPDPKSIVVDPWDKNILKEIEKAIIEANIGLNPANEGKIVRIAISSLTEETRKDLIKVLNDRLEKARITVRSIRDDIREEIIQAEKDKEISEDQRYDFQEDVDNLTKEINEQIKKIGEKKEEDIMTV